MNIKININLNKINKIIRKYNYQLVETNLLTMDCITLDDSKSYVRISSDINDDFSYTFNEARLNIFSPTFTDSEDELDFITNIQKAKIVVDELNAHKLDNIIEQNNVIYIY